MKFLHHASQYVSGDSYGYDYNEENNSLFIYLVDVMGHGVATALQTSTISLLFKQIARENLSVKEKVEWVNQACMPIFPSSYFATAFCADINLSTGEVNYVAAGINYFAYGKNGQIHENKVFGPLIGISTDMSFEEHTLHLDAGDSLYLLTDGLYEELHQTDLPNQYEKMYDQLKNLSENQSREDDATAVCFRML
nr:PP2C family protein-serine/threonine phosphatase [Alkalibacillus aidingensis]